MYNNIIPYANIIAGILVFIIGFIFHWVFQLISAVNWNLATKIGIQEKKLIPEFKVYEHAIAVADSLIGWIYGIAAVGLILNLSWAYKLAWIPGSILIYHGISVWFWMGNQTKSGHPINPNSFRALWSFINIFSGIFCLLIIW